MPKFVVFHRTNLFPVSTLGLSLERPHQFVDKMGMSYPIVCTLRELLFFAHAG